MARKILHRYWFGWAGISYRKSTRRLATRRMYRSLQRWLRWRRKP